MFSKMYAERHRKHVVLRGAGGALTAGMLASTPFIDCLRPQCKVQPLALNMSNVALLLGCCVVAAPTRSLGDPLPVYCR
jgi:hypothetical protein